MTGTNGRLNLTLGYDDLDDDILKSSVYLKKFNVTVFVGIVRCSVFLQFTQLIS